MFTPLAPCSRFCSAGALSIALAAKHHNIPLVVLTGLHKLTPIYAYDQDTVNEQNAPDQVLPFECFEEDWCEKVDVENPAFDYLSPELVSLFISDTACYNPSYVYRLLSTQYDAKDYSL